MKPNEEKSDSRIDNFYHLDFSEETCNGVNGTYLYNVF